VLAVQTERPAMSHDAKHTKEITMHPRMLLLCVVAFLAGMAGIGLAVVLMLPGWMGY